MGREVPEGHVASSAVSRHSVTQAWEQRARPAVRRGALLFPRGGNGRERCCCGGEGAANTCWNTASPVVPAQLPVGKGKGKYPRLPEAYFVPSLCCCHLRAGSPLHREFARYPPCLQITQCDRCRDWVMIAGLTGAQVESGPGGEEVVMAKGGSRGAEPCCG